MRKLKPEEVQENKVFHNNKESVRVLRTETREPQSPPLQAVVFQGLGNRGEERRLPIDEFRKQYQRRKK